MPNYESAASAPELAARYPLAMISPPARNFLNSSFVNVKSLRDIEGEPVIEMHADDAAARSLADGALVAATVTAAARLEEAMEGWKDTAALGAKNAAAAALEERVRLRLLGTELVATEAQMGDKNAARKLQESEQELAALRKQLAERGASEAQLHHKGRASGIGTGQVAVPPREAGGSE